MESTRDFFRKTTLGQRMSQFILDLLDFFEDLVERGTKDFPDFDKDDD